jgi:hypothetical protein
MCFACKQLGGRVSLEQIFCCVVCSAVQPFLKRGPQTSAASYVIGCATSTFALPLFESEEFQLFITGLWLPSEKTAL